MPEYLKKNHIFIMFTSYKDLTDVAVNHVEIMDFVYQLETTMDACVTKATLDDTSVNQVQKCTLYM